jgi:multiple sugar transport system substrate-binding protein
MLPPFGAWLGFGSCHTQPGSVAPPSTVRRAVERVVEEHYMAKRSSALVSALLTSALVVGSCTGGATPSPTTTGAASPSGSPAGSPGDGASPSPLEASGDIFAFGVSYETSDEIAQGRVDYFREQFPDVNVIFSESSFDAQQFLAALQSSDKPDVVRIPRDRLGTYVARELLEPLNDCIARAEVDMTVYRDAAVTQVTVDGTVYGMPEFFWPTNWLIDNDLFEEAGLDPAEFDVSNWDEIRSANQALLDQTDAKVAIDPKTWDNGDRFPMWVWAAGGQMISDDGRESLLDTPEVTEALEFTKSLIDAHGGITQFKDLLNQAGVDFFGEGNPLAEDLEAAWIQQMWYLNVLAGSSPDISFTAKPFMTQDGQPLSYAEGDALAVLADSDNKDAGCAFVTTMVSTDAWLAAAELRSQAAQDEDGIQTGTSTGNREADDQIFSDLVDLSDNEVFQAAVDENLSTLDSAFALPTTLAAEDFRQAWIDAVTAVNNGEMSAAEALQQADQDAQAAIDEAYGQ